MDDVTRKCGELQMTLLRQELQNLKTCQFAFLTTAFTATGLLLGLVPKLSESGYSWLGFLSPLVVVSPCSCFFFDKARTLTRIVGYYQYLEKLLTPPGFPAWETALSLSRDAMIPRGGKMRRFGRVMVMRQPHGYWSLAYYTFLSLSLLCLAGAWKLAFANGHLLSFRWSVLVSASMLVVGCVGRNLYLIWHLTVGANSYTENYRKWETRLRPESDKREISDLQPHRTE